MKVLLINPPLIEKERGIKKNKRVYEKAKAGIKVFFYEVIQVLNKMKY